MAGTGGKVAGIISIVLSALAAGVGIFYYLSQHRLRGLAALIACGVLLVLGIVLIAVTGRKSTQSPGT
jgi:TRAP-type C4-dicarboxylate transport system permease small subunit